MLTLGTATRDITPSSPCLLAGFAHRLNPWESIVSPLFLKVFVFEDGITHHRAAVVAADLIGWDQQETALLEEELCTIHNLDSVIFNATHTHCAPCTMTHGDALISGRDREYIQILYAAVKEAIAEAAGSVERVSLSEGSDSIEGFFVNRRLLTDQGVRCDPNPDGPVDHTVTLWRFDRDDGTTKALWIHAACHPTILSDNAVSSDFTGALVAAIAPYYPGATVAFLQGCCGDVRVNQVDGKGHFRRTGMEDMKAFSIALTDEVMRIVGRPMQSRGKGRLTSEVIVFEQTLNAEGNADGECVSVPIRITTLRLTEGAGLVGISGEPSVFYQFFIRSLSGPSLLPLGYCNGVPGYLPTAEQIREGGYEGLQSCQFFGLAGPFHPSLEAHLCKQIEKACRLAFGEALSSELLSFQ